MPPAQALSVKRAQVEFHNLASLGQPQRVLPHYAAQNINRDDWGLFRTPVRLGCDVPGRKVNGGSPFALTHDVNGTRIGKCSLDHPELFVLEAPVPGAAISEVVIRASPVWRAREDLRDLSVNISKIRLIPAESKCPKTIYPNTI